MQLVVKGKNMEVNERLKEFVEKKISRLERVLPSIAEAEVEFSTAKTKSAEARYEVQVTLKVNGSLIRGEQLGADTYSALDAVIDKIDRRVSKFKSKRPVAYEKVAAAKLPPEEEEEIEPAAEDEGRLVRVKKFPMKPMDVQEALVQMELLGHDFFVFYNSEIDAVSVVYKREDGHFGLIEPELV